MIHPIRRRPVTIQAGASAGSGFALMRRRHVGELAVVAANGQLVGVVSRSQLDWLSGVKTMDRRGHWTPVVLAVRTTVGELCEPDVVTVSSAQPFDEVAGLMARLRVDLAFVVDAHRRPTAVIHRASDG